MNPEDLEVFKKFIEEHTDGRLGIVAVKAADVKALIHQYEKFRRLVTHARPYVRVAAIASEDHDAAVLLHDIQEALGVE